MKRTAAYISIALLSAMATGCSSNSVIEREEPETPDGTPMRFSIPSVGNMETRSTRASQALTSDFLVSTYKAYKTGSQQTVMEQYQALYQQDGWSGTGAKWNTVGGTGDGYYQTQYEKYWDLSAFPYEFIGIAPAPILGNAVMAGFAVTDRQLKIQQSLYTQSATDGVVSPTSADQYLVSQMQRQHNADDATKTDDIDMITGKTIGSGGDSPTKAVPLPFHRLSSKVRFGIYTTMPVVETQSVKIKDVTFKVVSTNAEGFVTSVGNYSVDFTKSGVSSVVDGEFGDKTYQTGYNQLLSFSGPSEEFTSAYLEKHEWQSKNDVNAYYFECKDGLLQVPQSGVKLYVSFTLEPLSGEPYTVTDYPLTITDSEGNVVTEYTWRPNCLYTYYIVVNRLFSYDISFTATVSDWEDIEGRTTTDLEE